MDHHLTILALNAGLLLLAYLVIYPGFRVRNLGQMIVIDIGLTGFALFVAWWLYGGQGLSFSLILFDTNWAVFLIVTMLAMEWALFSNYCKRHGIEMFPDPARPSGDD